MTSLYQRPNVTSKEKKLTGFSGIKSMTLPAKTYIITITQSVTPPFNVKNK